MADGETQVAADDLTAEQMPGGLVGGAAPYRRSTIRAGSSIASRMAMREDIVVGHGADP